MAKYYLHLSNCSKEYTIFLMARHSTGSVATHLATKVAAGDRVGEPRCGMVSLSPPNKIQYNTPKEYTSSDGRQGDSSSTIVGISGAWYVAVKPDCARSMIFASSKRVIMVFSGFKSPCMTLCWCKNWIPFVICRAHFCQKWGSGTDAAIGFWKLSYCCKLKKSTCCVKILCTLDCPLSPVALAIALAVAPAVALAVAPAVAAAVALAFAAAVALAVAVAIAAAVAVAVAAAVAPCRCSWFLLALWWFPLGCLGCHSWHTYFKCNAMQKYLCRSM